MEERKPSEKSLLNLPTEIIEKICLYLALFDLKNIRLTCKWLYKLCNSKRFCRYERIIWSDDLINHVNMKSRLFLAGRSSYKLTIRNKTMRKSAILPVFQKLGSKIRSIDFWNCCFRPGSLECIIMQCEGLRSLHLDLSQLRSKNSKHNFTFEPLSIIRPHVTKLKITLPAEKPYQYFHRMVSIFPNVKLLEIETNSLTTGLYVEPALAEEYSSIFDDVMKSGSKLQDLKLKIPYITLLSMKADFFEALPRLKHLDVQFWERSSLTRIENWYPSFSNIQSVKLHTLYVFQPPEMIRLLTNTELKYLAIGAISLLFNEESFKKLVASRMTTMNFISSNAISGLPMTIIDSPLEVNNTVKYLYLTNCTQCPQSTEMLFPKYFHGLVHLTLRLVTDSILQCIFECQKNLRSLRLLYCRACSINGFCGSNDGGDFKYSINNLQKLEHLTLGQVPLEIIESEDLQRAFSLTRLKYLCLELYWNNQPGHAPLRRTRIPTDLFKDSTELRALRLNDAVIPSRGTLSSLFKNRKNLNYLRYDLNHNSRRTMVNSVAYIKKNCEYFSITSKKLENESRLGHAYYDEKLDRVVILNEGLNKTFHCLETRTFDIDWIKA